MVSFATFLRAVWCESLFAPFLSETFLEHQLQRHTFRRYFWSTDTYVIGSMGLIYLPTWMVDFYGFHVGKYTSSMAGMGYVIEQGIVTFLDLLVWCLEKVNKYSPIWWFFMVVYYGTNPKKKKKTPWQLGSSKYRSQTQVKDPKILPNYITLFRING